MLNYKNISKGWRLISTCCSIISKQSSSDQLDNQLSRWSLWLLGYSSFFSSDLLFTVGPSSKGSTPLTFGVQRFLRPWLIFIKISTPSRYFYNSHLMKQGPNDLVTLNPSFVDGHWNINTKYKPCDIKCGCFDARIRLFKRDVRFWKGNCSVWTWLLQNLVGQTNLLPYFLFRWRTSFSALNNDDQFHP